MPLRRRANLERRTEQHRAGRLYHKDSPNVPSLEALADLGPVRQWQQRDCEECGDEDDLEQVRDKASPNG